jgi:nucleoside 2-deoxyribosyltransferase
MKKIYLAGPDVFLPDAIDEGSKLKGLCTDYGFEGYFPLDNVLDGANANELATNIREANIKMIQNCDIVLANLSPFRGPEPDSGTVWEVGYAQGINKLVVAYSTDTRTLKEKTQEMLKLGNVARDTNDMEIEDFGLTHNLMFANIVIGKDFEECLKYLQTIKYNGLKNQDNFSV